MKIRPSDFSSFMQGGSGFNLTYLADHVHPTFSPAGSTDTLIVSFLAFDRWKVFPSARWPALWRMQVTSGCGAFQPPSNIPVTSKHAEFICIPRPGLFELDPAEFDNLEPPAGLTLQFDTDEVPNNTTLTVYIVEAESGTFIDNWGVTVDSSGIATLSTPTLDPGTYIVAIEYPVDLELDGSIAQLVVTGEPIIEAVAPPAGGSSKAILRKLIAARATPGSVSESSLPPDAVGLWVRLESLSGYLSFQTRSRLVRSGADGTGRNARFEIVDLNGGELRDGDPVLIRTFNYRYLAVSESMADIVVPQARRGDEFTIVSLDAPGMDITLGTRVAFLAPKGGHLSVNARRNGLVEVSHDGRPFHLIIR